MISVNGIGGVGEKVKINGNYVTESMELNTYSGENPLSILSDPVTIPANTLIDEDLEVVNAAPLISVDGEVVAKNMNLESIKANIQLPDMPSQDGDYSFVSYRGEIHAIGARATVTLDGKGHYKFDGESWTLVSTTPHNMKGSLVTVYNDEIHALGSSNDTYEKRHYKWNGSAWTSVSTLSTGITGGSIFVHDNKIKVAGGGSSSTAATNGNIRAWDGSSWTSEKIYSKAGNTTMYKTFRSGAAVVLDGVVHLLGGGSSSTADDTTDHRVYNAEDVYWEVIDTLPYSFHGGKAEVKDGQIHIMSGIGNEQGHYKWDGTQWIECVELPITTPSTSCLHDGEIKIGKMTQFYSVDETVYKEVD